MRGEPVVNGDVADGACAGEADADGAETFRVRTGDEDLHPEEEK